LRFDYQSAWTERYNRFSTFDPGVPNPVAGGRPGAIAFASSSNNKFDRPPRDAFGPRFGFGYRLRNKTVLRGGYGIYYAGIAFADGGTPNIGFSTNPTAPNLTNGISPAFRLDAGFPRANIVFPPRLDPAVANGTSPTGYVKEGLTLPRYQNWSTTVQHQLSNSMLLDVTYAGNHGTRLPQSPAYLGVLDNINDPSILKLTTRVLQADINSQEAKDAGIGLPYAGFTGNVAQALRPFPQYQTIGYRALPIGWSN
jgi:hypothetical protein